MFELVQLVFWGRDPRSLVARSWAVEGKQDAADLKCLISELVKNC